MRSMGVSASASVLATSAHIKSHAPIPIPRTIHTASSMPLSTQASVTSPLPSSTPSSSFSSSSSSPSASSDSDVGSIDFGFRRVPVSEKQGLVHSVFARVARSYDVMNDAMSMGVHRLWKHHLVQRLQPAANVKHLDVAGGTGDIGFRILRAAEQTRMPDAYKITKQKKQVMTHDEERIEAEREYEQACQVIICDINANMLQVGIERARQQYGYEPGPLITPLTTTAAASMSDPSSSSHAVPLPSSSSSSSSVERLSASRLYAARGSLSFVEGNAELLPFEDSSFDSYTIVFGLRNVTHRDRALAEAYRVLKPGGRFMCMEFSRVLLPGLDALYAAYSQHIIPQIGHVLVNDRDSYQYLVESIARFPDQRTLAGMVRHAGFQAVNVENLSGGIVAIHSAFKQK